VPSISIKYPLVITILCSWAVGLTSQDKQDQFYLGAAGNRDVSGILQQQQRAAWQYTQKVNDVGSLKINGHEYVSYFSPAQGNPYFNSLNLVESIVILEDSSIYMVKSKYDTHLDQLVYLEERTPVNGRFLQISANKSLVAAFTLGGEFHFEKISFSGEMMQDGFYEILHRGQSEVIVRHQSEILQGSSQDQFRRHATHYVNLGNGYIPITSHRKFMKLFEDKRPQMKRYIKSMGVYNLTAATRKQLIQVFEYYDSIE
jgi:hypothetical protein